MNKKDLTEQARQCTEQARMETKKPYHIQAGELGANLRAIQALKRGRRYSATTLKTIWDYRKAGLTIDEAHNYIKAWQTKSYHPRTPERSKNYGRMVVMAQVAARKKLLYMDYLANLKKLEDTGLSWANTHISWSVKDRTIITIRHEDVTWPDYGYGNQARWPESSTVSYTSHLLRTDMPGTIALYNSSEYDFARLAAEKSLTHNLRGNWRQRILDILLPGQIYTAPPKIRYKAVAVINNEYCSIYDGSEYQIGVRRNGTAKTGHNGGYYCYASIEEARNADVPYNSAYPDSPRVILQCEVGGKMIRYDNKLCYSWITPIATVTDDRPGVV